MQIRTVCVSLFISLLLFIGVVSVLAIDSIHIVRTFAQTPSLFFQLESTKKIARVQRNLRILDVLTLKQLHSKIVQYTEALDCVKQGVDVGQKAMEYQRVALGNSQDDAVIPFQTLLLSSKEFVKTYRAVVPYKENFLEDARRFFPAYEPQLERIFSVDPQEMDEVLFALESIATGEKKRFLLLLQNNMELRPTGGFLGSYADIVFENAKIQSIEVHDIYAPDGQVNGYIQPPKPIADYLYQSGGWKLRDANWDPDFPTSAKTIAWFFEKAGYPTVDGVIAITFSTMSDMIAAVGPLYLPDYDRTVTEHEMYLFTQQQSEQSFFPGATNKSDVLGALSRAFFRKLNTLTYSEVLQLISTMQTHMRQNNILVWFQEDTLEKVARSFQVDGSIQVPVCHQKNCYVDYLYLVESNVGINKTNCCMQRTVSYDVWFDSVGSFSSSLSLWYKNDNPTTPKPPFTYGGGYNNYLRVLRSPKATLQSYFEQSLAVPTHLQTVENRKDGTVSFGKLIQIGGGEERTVEYRFAHDVQLDPSESIFYTVYIQKQPGLTTNAYTVAFHVPQGMGIALTNQFDQKNNAQVERRPDGIVIRLPVETNTEITVQVTRE